MIRALLATYIEALTLVYTVLILLYILQSWIRIGYSAPVMTLRRFLDETVAPYLMLFRRVIPPLGPLDLSAMIGLFVLWIASGIVRGIIAG
jgi:YggT family protein